MAHGATILDADGLRLTAAEKDLFREVDPFGFILFARNIDTADQVRALCADFRDAVGRDCLITIDQEGGRVQRLRPPLARDWSAPLEFVEQAGAQAERALYLRYRLIAQELHALGIDSNCAPVGDLVTPQTHPFLRNRCYGSEVATVVRLARAVAQAHLDGGVLPVLKHMPGHGRATADSHKDLPHVEAPLATLQAQDFSVFQQLNDLPLGMTAHLVYEALDDLPATISAKVMQMIRQEIGFEGLIMTDDISMKALTGTDPEKAADSVAAGCDLVLYCNAPLEARRAVAEAAGVMSEAASHRAAAAMAQRQAPKALDTAAADAELCALMGAKVHEGQ
ncbi:beta-N-acetylhexosaminidase [Pseudophaeobacter sp.]|uniref:beta-N-acetylhexosaminidase n=1 Tax=Pseudophaeobacter sp. TaxID=1971739 RepID=UPI003297BBD5